MTPAISGNPVSQATAHILYATSPAARNPARIPGTRAGKHDKKGQAGTTAPDFGRL